MPPLRRVHLRRYYVAWSFSIGHLFGSDVRIHVTFLILMAWIGLSIYATAGGLAAAWNMLFVAALFACVLAHEFGHALMARRYGIATPTVTLLPIGGLAQLNRMPEKPADEIAVALAGPAVNVVIWLLLTLFFDTGVSMIEITESEHQMTTADFVGQLAAINLTLAIFNMLPAFPMDGGRVLRALLTIKLGRVRGTEAAAFVGRTLAIGLGLWGLYIGNPILVFVAAFVYFAASAETAQDSLRQVAARHRARDAMITEYHALAPDDLLSDATEAILRSTQHEFPVLDGQGRAMGFLTRATVFKALAGSRPEVHVADLMVTDMPEVGPEAGLDLVFEQLAGDPAGAVLVVDRQRVLMGYITQENLGELMVIARTEE